MQESDLRHLPSYEFYDGFNKKDNLCNSADHFDQISENFQNNERIREIFNMLIANIFYFRDKHIDNTPFLHNHCYALNYWLYDQWSTLHDQKKKILLLIVPLQNLVKYGNFLLKKNYWIEIMKSMILVHYCLIYHVLEEK
ncbi:CYIR protein, partial [Plasmodium cynomolgi strain B]